MESDNLALTRLLIANIIGYLAAEYSDKQNIPLADSMQIVMDSRLYPQLVDIETALYCEGLPWLYEKI